jgi:hypothetical protein
MDAGFGSGFGPQEPRSEVQARPKAKAEVVPEDAEVVRWVMRAAMTKRTQRKLYGVCVLTEGDCPLRVVDSDGNIVISEDSGVLVDPVAFPVVAGLFGL